MIFHGPFALHVLFTYINKKTAKATNIPIEMNNWINSIVNPFDIAVYFHCLTLCPTEIVGESGDQILKVPVPGDMIIIS